jgi:hypothetical protein
MSMNVSSEGDPGKLAYLHNPDWKIKPMVDGFKTDGLSCPGCVFHEPLASRKWPHTGPDCKLIQAVKTTVRLFQKELRP